MGSDLALQWLLEAQRSAHAAAKRLDEAVEEHRRLTQKRSDEFLDWALQAGRGNPKYDDDWNINSPKHTRRDKTCQK